MLCGCSKKLTCTYKTNYEDIKINNKIVFNFKDNTYRQRDIMTFLDSDKANEYYEDIEEYVDDYNLILDNNKIISELDGEIKLDGDKKKLKEQYESYEYTCK